MLQQTLIIVQQPYLIIFLLAISQKKPNISLSNGKLKAKSTTKFNASPSNAGTGPSNTSTSPFNAGARPSNTAFYTFYSKAIKSASGKIVPGTFCKTSTFKTPGPKKKVVYYSRQINKNNYLYLLTIKAKYNGTLIYKKRQGIKRVNPGYIRP